MKVPLSKEDICKGYLFCQEWPDIVGYGIISGAVQYPPKFLDSHLGTDCSFFVTPKKIPLINGRKRGHKTLSTLKPVFNSVQIYSSGAMYTLTMLSQ